MSYLKSYRNNRTFLHTAGTYMHAESIYLCHVKNVIRIMKRLLILILWAGFAGKVFAQLSLDICLKKAQANYPLVRQYELISMTENYDLSNAAKGNLPQVAMSGKASYQSDVTTIPLNILGYTIESLPKDQYQIMVEVNQNIWDGGQIYHNKQKVKAASDENRRQADVSMYALNERVNQIFFGILLIDEQLRQNNLLETDLNRNLKNVTAYRENGLANNADVDAVNVEILNTRQKRLELENNRLAYVRMLSLLIGEEIKSDTEFMKPVAEENLTTEIKRPELALYAAQEHRLDVASQALKAGYMPRFSIFLQGAYGNPGLNMLKNEFEPYYMVGARLNWNFGTLYTLKNDRKKLEAERRQVYMNRDLFLLNTRVNLSEQEAAIKTLRKQMETDDEIIRMRTNIRCSAEAKVANGTLTVTEMLRELTNESLARQNKAFHEISLLMEIYKHKQLTNTY